MNPHDAPRTRQGEGEPGRQAGFTLFDHTADAGIEARGEDLATLFVNAARALFTLIADPSGVRESVRREIVVEARDREALLVNWLNELIFLVDAEQLLFCRFCVLECSDTRLRAIAYGEGIDPARHQLKSAVKAATYHMLSVVDGPPMTARVVLDL